MDKDNYMGGVFLAGILVFAAVWIYAISEWGLLLGIMFGWIPALIAGIVGGFIWPVLVIGLVLLLWLMFK